MLFSVFLLSVFKTTLCQICVPSVGYTTHHVIITHLPSVNGISKPHLGSCVDFCFHGPDGVDVALFKMSTRMCLCSVIESRLVLYQKFEERMEQLEAILRFQPEQSKSI